MYAQTALGALAILISAPLAAQPSTTETSTARSLSSDQLEERKQTFAWLLGTWKADHMFGPNTSRNGAQITFLLEPDGTVSARLDKMSPWMESSEKRFADLVGKRFIRGINASGDPKSVWTHSASGGRVFNKNSGEWINLGIIYVSRDTGKLSHLGAMSDFAEWVKVSGSSTASPLPDGDGSTAPAPAGNEASAEPAAAPPAAPVPQSSTRKCNYQMYTMLAMSSADSVISQFEADVDEVATYDPDLPIQRMYPNPIKSAAEIPVKYMNFEDYRHLTRMEEVTAEVVAQSGPDDALTKAERQITRLFKEARQSYGISARVADATKKPCPQFSDADAYPKIMEADAAIKTLLARRDGYLKGRLSAGEKLNEKLTRAFYGDLAGASSLSEKQKNFVDDLKDKSKNALKSFVTGEQVEPETVEALVPQLEAMRERYAEMEARGVKVSDEMRDKDMKEALKRSGIDYDPAITRNARRDGQLAVGKFFYDTLMAEIGPKPTGLSGIFASAQSYVTLAKFSADSLNALKNFYTLFGTDKDLMPVALAVQENRAYLRGLVQRYDIFEQEYRIMRSNFENAITEGGALSESE